MNDFFAWLVSLIREAKWWVIIQPWERAVRVRLGKRCALWEPGFYWRIPILDDVRVINNRLRIAAFPCLTVTTKDGKTVTAAGNIGFHIADPLKAMLRLQQPEYTVGALAQSAVAGFIAERNIGEIVIADLEEAARVKLVELAEGIDFEFVRMIDFAAVRTYRFLQDQWRPATNNEQHL